MDADERATRLERSLTNALESAENEEAKYWIRTALQQLETAERSD